MLFCGVSQWGVLVHIRQFETYFELPGFTQSDFPKQGDVIVHPTWAYSRA